MNKIITAVLLGAVTVSVQASSTISVTDNGTSGYGNAAGFAIDFDSATPTAGSGLTINGWTPSLISGTTYSIDSISIEYHGAITSGNGTNVYLGVYSTLNSDATVSGFLGTSANTLDFSTATADTYLTFNFSGINVTADSTADGAGSGMLYFVWQDDTSSHTGFGTNQISIDRSATTIDQSFSDIIAYGALTGTRSPNFQAIITAVPEPASLALVGAGIVALGAIRRFKK